MNYPATSKRASLALIGLAYGGIVVMSAADAPRAAVPAAVKLAAKQADRATKALGRHDAADAVTAGEGAVAFAPRVAGYRMLLGQSYLQAGRFASAAQAFADTLALDPGNDKAALNLALAQIALGDWQTARATLAAHAATMPAGDRGLALALAGDTAGAVELLTATARSPASSPKIRQNLALAYALAGQWQIARVVAAADMSPADVDARIEQWATFAQPERASDQVASLLGVRVAADAGQPAALALNAAMVPATALAAAPVAVAPVIKKVAVATGVAFGPRQEVIQALPATLIAPAPGPIKVAVPMRLAATPRVATAKPEAVRTPAVARGTWFVQLGAYGNAGIARDAWGHARQRFAAWSGRTPYGVAFRTATASFYRLSVGGFARADAVRVCRQYKAHGGDCFVRAGAGDQVANWIRPGGPQVAMR